MRRKLFQGLRGGFSNSPNQWAEGRLLQSIRNGLRGGFSNWSSTLADTILQFSSNYFGILRHHHHMKSNGSIACGENQKFNGTKLQNTASCTNIVKN